MNENDSQVFTEEHGHQAFARPLLMSLTYFLGPTMNSKFATTLAIAALAAAASTASFANDSAFPLTSASQRASAVASTGISRAQVQAELQNAQRMGYNTNFSDSQFIGANVSGKASTVTRAQVTTEALQARRFDANDSLYRN